LLAPTPSFFEGLIALRPSRFDDERPDFSMTSRA
jgi:hypothetical protein